MMEVIPRYSNRPDLLGPMMDVLRRIKESDQSDEPGCVESRELGSVRPSDRLSEADIWDISDRFSVSKLSLAEEYGMSLSTMKRLLKARNARRVDARASSSRVL
jgi:hypothetical protein